MSKMERPRKATVAKPTTEQRQELTREHLDGMEIAIRSENYACRKANRGYFYHEEERGLLFMVFCDDDTKMYRVISRPDNTFLVEPW